MAQGARRVSMSSLPAVFCAGWFRWASGLATNEIIPRDGGGQEEPVAFSSLTPSGLDFQAPFSLGLAHDRECPMHGVSLSPGSTSTLPVPQFSSSALFLD